MRVLSFIFRSFSLFVDNIISIKSRFICFCWSEATPCRSNSDDGYGGYGGYGSTSLGMFLWERKTRREEGLSSRSLVFLQDFPLPTRRSDARAKENERQRRRRHRRFRLKEKNTHIQSRAERQQTTTLLSRERSATTGAHHHHHHHRTTLKNFSLWPLSNSWIFARVTVHWMSIESEKIFVWEIVLIFSINSNIFASSFVVVSFRSMMNPTKPSKEKESPGASSSTQVTFVSLIRRKKITIDTFEFCFYCHFSGWNQISK